MKITDLVPNPIGSVCIYKRLPYLFTEEKVGFEKTSSVS